MTLNANPHKNYQSMLKVGQRKPLTSRRQAVQKNPSVVVKLSEGAVALSEIQGLEKLNSVDRTERIQGLKQAIQNGQYRVDSFLIAQALLEEEKALKSLVGGMDEGGEDEPAEAGESLLMIPQGEGDLVA
ncbi:MAG: flagellar biosynthesis anti-sigma factor FlgM [Nitrospinota bacterium]|jgi:flagellar biosynthesis anti-sigma factor FlgM|nr:flagellar biosynthesis anti-sigma factor FlgM [Nitrospinota bacterium]MDP7385036.1 flagellar biosynthesis anti-sigma factor FlgM [Nitrospinota bacterium]